MFKKTFAVSLALLLLLLCGCGGKKTVNPALDGISFSAEIDYGGNEFICDTSISDCLINLTVTSPQELNGLKLSVEKNNLIAEFNGLSQNYSIVSLPQSAVVRILFDVFNDVADNKTADFTSENCKIKSQVNGCNYVFEFSPSGLPIVLEIEDMDLKIDFKNVTVNQ